jgi:hypothetical protein
VEAIATQTLEVINSPQNRVGTLTTYESPVFVCNHRPPERADEAIWTSDHERCVGVNRSHLSVVGQVGCQSLMRSELCSSADYKLGVYDTLPVIRLLCQVLGRKVLIMPRHHE